MIDATGSIDVAGQLLAGGGTGGHGESDGYLVGAGGGGGAGGRIKVYGPVLGVVSTPQVAGGRGEEGDGFSADPCHHGRRGGRGTIYIDAWVAGPPTVMAAGACDAVTLTVSGGTPHCNIE